MGDEGSYKELYHWNSCTVTRPLPASRRQFLTLLASIGFAALVRLSTETSAQETSDGIRVLAREKSLAEQFLVIMNDFGKKDLTQYAQGIVLYAQAKAEFDGLITQLEDQLEQSRSPNEPNVLPLHLLLPAQSFHLQILHKKVSSETSLKGVPT